VERHHNRAKSLYVRHQIKKPKSPEAVVNFESVFFEDIEDDSTNKVDVEFKPDDEIMEEDDDFDRVSRSLKKRNSGKEKLLP